MASENVERFVGLLVSDEEFIKQLIKDFDGALAARELQLEANERIILKESFENYVKYPYENPAMAGGGFGTVAAVPAAVGAAVAASVAGSVASKIVDKLFDSKMVTPINIRLRESMLQRRMFSERSEEARKLK